MATAQQVEQLAERADRFISDSPLQQYQIHDGKGVAHIRLHNRQQNLKYYQVYEKDQYSQIQNFLYKRALLGLNIYTKQEIKDMHWKKRKRIQRIHKRAQKILNLWKQQVLADSVSKFFKALFPRSPLTKELVEGASVLDPEFKNTLSFKDLGISKDMVVKKLHEEGVLPPDFFSLK